MKYTYSGKEKNSTQEQECFFVLLLNTLKKNYLMGIKPFLVCYI